MKKLITLIGMMLFLAGCGIQGICRIWDQLRGWKTRAGSTQMSHYDWQICREK